MINCHRWRKKIVAERFVDLLSTYKFRLVQDEDYLNVLCKDNVKMISLGWNKTAYKNNDFNDSDLNLIHWKINWRPWKYKDVLYEEHFWKYAKMTDFYDDLIKMRDGRSDELKKQDTAMFENLQKMAQEDIDDPNNYLKTIGKQTRSRKLLNYIIMFIKFRKLINLRIFRKKL